jgi:hypothetical protein
MKLTTIITKLKEPSTVAGLVALLGVAGISVPVEVVQYASMLVVAAAGLFEVVRKEG